MLGSNQPLREQTKQVIVNSRKKARAIFHGVMMAENCSPMGSRVLVTVAVWRAGHGESGLWLKSLVSEGSAVSHKRDESSLSLSSRTAKGSPMGSRSRLLADVPSRSWKSAPGS